MAIGVPLKLKDSADFQDFSSTDENYLAYQVGLYLVSGDSSSVGALALDSNGTNVIQGTLTDTSFDSAVGTGGDGSYLSYTTITSYLRQNLGTISITDSDYRIPVYQYDSGGQRIIQESTESDLNTLVDRLNSRIFTSDYLGTYKLGSSAPSGDYSIELANITTDTRADGTSTQYNIYQRTTQTPPTKVLPFSIKRLNGDSGDYQGLQLMTDRQIQQSLGLKARNRIGADSDGIGSYKVLSSTAGTPTDNGYSGTWVAKGTATDTRQAVVDANYSRSRVSTYARLRVSSFSADYTRTRSSSYVGDFIQTRSSSYNANYQRTRQSNYSLGFIGNYVNNFTRNRSSNYSRVLSYLGNYTRTRESNYLGNYARVVAYEGNYSRNVTYTSAFTYVAGDYQWAIAYTGGSSPNFNFSVQITWNSILVHNQIYTAASADATPSEITVGDYTYTRGSVQGTPGPFGASYSLSRSETVSINYARNRDSTFNYTRNRSSNIIDTYTRDRESTFNFARVFIGDYTFDFTRTTPDDFSRNFVGNYSRDFSRTRTSTYNRTRSSNFVGNYLGDFVGDFLGNYARTSTYTSSVQYSESAPEYHMIYYSDGDPATYNGMKAYWNGALIYDSVGSGGAQPDSFTVGAFTYYRDSTVQKIQGGGGFPSAVWYGIYREESTELNFTRTSLRNTEIVNSITRESNYLGNYSRDFTVNRSSTYARTRTSTYLGAENFSRNFTGDYVGNYSRDFTVNRTSNFSRNFIGNYQGNYSRNYIGNYARTFVGNYAGDTIGSGNVTIQTFTLYVRIA